MWDKAKVLDTASASHEPKFLPLELEYQLALRLSMVSLGMSILNI